MLIVRLLAAETEHEMTAMLGHENSENILDRLLHEVPQYCSKFHLAGRAAAVAALQRRLHSGLTELNPRDPLVIFVNKWEEKVVEIQRVHSYSSNKYFSNNDAFKGRRPNKGRK